MPKTAILSHVLPPSWSGQAVMLYRLLKDVKPDNYCLIASESYIGNTQFNNITPELPAKLIKLPPEWKFQHGKYRFPRIRWFINFFIPLFIRSYHIAKILRGEQCSQIIACSGDLIDLPAGYLASKLNRIDFGQYIFDDYVYQFSDPDSHRIANSFDKIMTPNADIIITPNEFMALEMKKRGGKKVEIVRNPCEYPPELTSPSPVKINLDAVKIVFTGAIYHVNYDVIRNLISAINMIKDKNIILHIYSAQTENELKIHRITGPVVFHDHLPVKESVEVQKNADILFLPLSFHSPIPHLIKTSAPGKMGEYLASGRPILAHVPKDSFVNWYLSQYECGLVVSEDNPQTLAEAIKKLIAEQNYCQSICKNAIERARVDYDPEKAREKFLSIISPE